MTIIARALWLASAPDVLQLPALGRAVEELMAASPPSRGLLDELGPLIDDEDAMGRLMFESPATVEALLAVRAALMVAAGDLEPAAATAILDTCDETARDFQAQQDEKP